MISINASVHNLTELAWTLPPKTAEFEVTFYQDTSSSVDVQTLKSIEVEL